MRLWPERLLLDHGLPGVQAVKVEAQRHTQSLLHDNDCLSLDPFDVNGLWNAISKLDQFGSIGSQSIVKVIF